MATVSTELDLEIQKLKTKAEEVKAEFRKMSQEAEKTKLGEKLGASLQKSTLNEFRALKEAAVKAAKERGEAAKRAELAAMTPSANEVWGVHAATKGAPPAAAGGRGGKLNVGMAAMQVQDIAVQAQMGVSWMTIMAQQGSQLASMFGTGGMLLGGVAAIGGVAFSAGQRANEAFKSMIDNAKALRDELSGLSGESASMGELSAAIERLEQSTKELAKAGEDLDGLGSMVAGSFGALMGGESYEEKKLALQEAQNLAIVKQYQLIQQLMKASEESVKVAELRAAGENEMADAYEAQVRLAKELAEIENMPRASDRQKDALKADAERRSEIEAEERRKKYQDERQAQRDRFNAAEKAVENVGQKPWEKLQDLDAERQALEGKIAGADGEKEKLELAIKREEIERQIVELQMQMVEEGKRLAKEREERVAGLKKTLENTQFAGMSDPEKLKVLEKRLEGAQSRMNSQDEEERLKAQIEAAQTKQEMDAIMARAEQAGGRGVSAPGAISSQFDWAMGGGSSLVNDEQAKNTREMGALRDEVKRLREKLPDTFGDNTARFAP
jgi:hypothetical protein